MNYCLDSSIIIDILRGDSNIKSKIELLSKQNNFCITPIVLSELFKGAYLAEKQKEAIKLVENFSNSVELLEFTPQACRIFGQKHAELTKQGKQTQESDLMIASISIAHNVTFITRNPKDFVNIQGLNIISW